MTLTNVLHPVNYNGGLVLQGFSSLLFPASLQCDLVQWHNVSNEDRKLQLSTASVLESSRVKGVDFEKLAPLRTFLGYCKTGSITLGTERSSYDRIGYSPDCADKRTVDIISASFSAGTTGLSIAGINASAMVTLPRGLQVTARIDLYKNILRTAKETSVVLYHAGEGEKRGWLVSMLSTILHMAHAWASQVPPDPEQRIPHTVANQDGGKAAYDVFCEDSGIILERSPVERGEYRPKDLVIGLWGGLNNRLEEQILARKASLESFVVKTKRLRGWEAMDVVIPTPFSSMTTHELHSDCGWNRPSEEMPILSCQGLGELIKPPVNAKSVRPGIQSLEAKTILSRVGHIWSFFRNERELLTRSQIVDTGMLLTYHPRDSSES